MTDRPTDRALSIALETLDQIGSMTKRGRASVSARSTAIFIRTNLESRAPADPAPTDSVAIGSKSVGQEHPDGIRCCDCDADWTPAEVYRLRAKIAARSQDADDARRWRELVETWGGMQCRGERVEIGISTPRWRVPAGVENFNEAFDRRYKLDDAMDGANDQVQP